jgi:hypothetical protein
MPQELVSVARPAALRESCNTSDQPFTLQLGKIVLRLAYGNADLSRPCWDRRTAFAILAGIAHQAAVRELGAGRYGADAYESFGIKTP